MSEINLFEVATREKLRFPSSKGLLMAEDLWDLPLTSVRGTSLDAIAKVVNRSLKADDEESFVTPKPAANTLERVKLDILKHVIKSKIEENEAAKTAAANKAKKQRIMEIISAKQDDALAAKSLDELKEMLSSL